MARWFPSSDGSEGNGVGGACCEAAKIAPGSRFCSNCGTVVQDLHSLKEQQVKKDVWPKKMSDEEASFLKSPTDLTKGNTIGLKGLVFLCGLAAFARTEAVLLQTQYFAMCRGYGPQFFYAISAALIFVPGPMVIAFVRKMEHGSTVSVATRVFRKIVIANVSTTIALACLILEIVVFDVPAEKDKLAYIYMPIIGIGASLHFQAISQALAFFPPIYMSIMLVGCFCPFIVYVPINAVGHLCSAEFDQEAGELSAPCSGNVTGNAAVQDSCVTWEANWQAIYSFFGTSIVLCLQAIISFDMLRKNPVAQHYLQLADDCAEDSDDKAASDDDCETSKLLGNIQNGDATAPISQLDAPSSLMSGSPFRVALPQLYSTVVVTIASLLVTSQYGMVPVENHFMYLSTYLMYEFYICSCIGALLAMALPLNGAWSVVLSTLRAVVVPLTFSYESMGSMPPLNIPRSNVMALAVNFVFIVSGSWVFTSTFSMLQTKLADRPSAKKWALNLNNGLYFLAMIVALSVSVAIGFLVWGPDGAGP